MCVYAFVAYIVQMLNICTSQHACQAKPTLMNDEQGGGATNLISLRLFLEFLNNIFLVTEIPATLRCIN